SPPPGGAGGGILSSLVPRTWYWLDSSSPRATLQGKGVRAMIKTLLLCGIAVALAGCATKKYMMSRPLDAGVKGVYKAPFDKVRRAAQDALAERGFHFDRDKD